MEPQAVNSRYGPTFVVWYYCKCPIAFFVLILYNAWVGGREDEKVSGRTSEPDLLPFLAFVQLRASSLYEILQNAEATPERRLRLDKLLGMVLELSDACQREGIRQDALRATSGESSQAAGSIQPHGDPQWQSWSESVLGRAVKEATTPIARRSRRGGSRRR